MKISNRTRAGIAVVACAAVGAAGGIAASAAAPGKPSAGSSTTTTPSARATRPPGPRHRGPGHAVHAEAVVLNKAGDAFITETIDHGKLKSVSGRDITITEAIGGVTYKDVTITLPAAAKIERNGKTATIDALKAGDRIGVSQSSDGTFVHAADASFRPRRHGHGGPHPGGRRPG
jgi:hypothetical protein